MFVRQQKKMFDKERNRDIVGMLSASLCSYLEGAAAVLKSPVGPRLGCFRDPPSSLNTKFLNISLWFQECLVHRITEYLSLKQIEGSHECSFPQVSLTISLLITGQPGFVPFPLPSSFKVLSSSPSGSWARALLRLWDRYILSGVAGPHVE